MNGAERIVTPRPYAPALPGNRVYVLGTSFAVGFALLERRGGRRLLANHACQQTGIFT
jgi:hypothetical protein